MFVSVTRLRLRHWWYLPLFAVHALRSRTQVRRSGGFIGGQFATEMPWVFWTITGWSDEKAMRTFRNTAAHLTAMPRLSHWCDEASYVHWEQPNASLPDAAAVVQRLRDDGKLSKVRHPSATHAAGSTVGKAPPTMAAIIPPSSLA